MNLPNVIKKFTLSGHKGAVYRLWGKENYLYSVSGDGYLVEWDLETLDGKAILSYPSPLFALAVTPSYLVVGTMDGCVLLYDREKHRVSRYQVSSKPVYFLCDFNDTRVLIGEGSGYLHELNLSEKKVKCVWKSEPLLPLRCVEQVENGFIIGGYEGFLWYLQSEGYHTVYRYKAHAKTIFSLKRHGEILWSGGRDAYLRGWMWKTGEQVVEIPAHYFTVNQIDLDEGQRFLFTGSRDKTIRIWDLDTYRLLRVIDFPRRAGHQASVNTLFFHSKPGLLFSGGDDRQIIGWRIERVDSAPMKQPEQTNPTF